MQALEGLSTRVNNFTSNVRAAGEADLGNRRVHYKGIARRRPVSVNNIDDARGNSRLETNQRELIDAHGRLFGHFNDH